MARVDVGDSAPAFELPGTGDRSYGLADFRGRGVILAFYPGDFTTVCTRQFCSYRDESDRVTGLGVQMLGISPQSVGSHERFREKYGLNVPLLADEDKAVARAYGVLGPAGLVRRSIFTIDADLVVRYRNVKRLGLTYESVEGLERAAAALR